jgi:hypothetical protein
MSIGQVTNGNETQKENAHLQWLPTLATRWLPTAQANTSHAAVARRRPRFYAWAGFFTRKACRVAER